MSNPFGGGDPAVYSQPAHDVPPLHPVPAAVVAEWPPGTFLENLAPSAAHPGSWLVTIPSHNRVDRVDPDGSRHTVAEVPNAVTGIATTGFGTFVLTGVMGAAGWQLARIDESTDSAGGSAGTVDIVCDIPDLRLGNGLAWDGRRLFAVDSALGHLVAIDPVAGTSAVWLAHELLGPLERDSPLPGANGITVHDPYVYVTNSGRALLLRCPLTGHDLAGELEVVAEQQAGDDFDIDPRGRVYLATNVQHSVVRLDPDGHREGIAGLEQWVAGATSAALDPRDPTALYVTSTGGILNPPPGGVQPGRLVRLTLDS